MVKRKLDKNDAPTIEVVNKDAGSQSLSQPQQVDTVPATGEGLSAASSSTSAFDGFQLDPRLLQALANAQYASPTDVQARTIPLAQEGKSILVRSKTGSGKTVAYAIPCLQALLKRSKSGSKVTGPTALVLVPTRELSAQVSRTFASLSEFCGKEVKILNLARKASESVLLTKLQDIPDIVVSTPSQVAVFLKKASLDLSGIEQLVVDEADLVLSYGYEDDVQDIAAALSATTQILLVSASLAAEVDQLKGIFARDYTLVDVEDAVEEGQEVKQFVIKCGEQDKFLLIYVIFKLKLVKGKCIIFVHDVDRSYHLKLYLEQYGIKSCILNSELPVNSRLHAVQEFNKGLHDILIAADDQEVIGGIRKKAKSAVASEGLEEEEAEDADEREDQASKRRRPSLRSKDFGVSRGIDFQNVACVLNFDLPPSSKSYTHRIGRTARAGRSGMALSFVVPKDQFGKHKYTSVPAARHDERVLEKIKTRQTKKGKELLNYAFDMAQVEGFRYRMEDALKAVTPNKIREARTREIKQELLKSEKLAKHFEENPDDLKALRHDTNSSAGVIKVQSHLKHIPDYLVPAGKRQKLGANGGFVSFNKEPQGSHRKGHRKGRSGRPQGKKMDPLKSFKSKRK